MSKSGWQPSIVPYGADETVYLVVDRFGGFGGGSYRETEVERTDLETVISDLSSGQFNDPIRVVAFNTLEHWSEDVSMDIARDAISKARASPSTFRILSSTGAGNLNHRPAALDISSTRRLPFQLQQSLKQLFARLDRWRCRGSHDGRNAESGAATRQGPAQASVRDPWISSFRHFYRRAGYRAGHIRPGGKSLPSPRENCTTSLSDQKARACWWDASFQKRNQPPPCRSRAEGERPIYFSSP
jgi:hypothetical protein